MPRGRAEATAEPTNGCAKTKGHTPAQLPLIKGSHARGSGYARMRKEFPNSGSEPQGVMEVAKRPEKTVGAAPQW